MAVTWDPRRYAQVSGERARPLAAPVSGAAAATPGRGADPACGRGPMTPALADRWPGARVVGVDTSREMLASARERDTDERVEWVEADLAEWDPSGLGAAPDVIVTNAALQWVPRHLSLMEAWLEALAPGG